MPTWIRCSARLLTLTVTCRSEEHTSELQSPCNLVCRLLLEKKKYIKTHVCSIRTSQQTMETLHEFFSVMCIASSRHFSPFSSASRICAIAYVMQRSGELRPC